MPPDSRSTAPRQQPASPATQPQPQTQTQPRLGQASRLTIGWRESRGPASLRTHVGRYGPLPAPASGGPQSLIAAVTEAGLTGRGGGGFPAGTKLRAVADQRGTAVVVANGMEGEPASQKDEALLAKAPHLVLDGAVLAATALGARTIHLCVSREATTLQTVLQAAIAERRQAGFDLGHPVQLSVHGLPHRFVASSETAIISWLNGDDAKPTAVPPRPFEKGAGRHPTLVSNVETLAHLALIARYGPVWYRNAGRTDSPGTMLTTLSGALAEPGVYEIESGTTVGATLALGRPAEDASAVLVGGYFGTWHRLREVADVPLAAGPLRMAGAAPGAGVLYLLPAGACGLTETAWVLAWLASQSAGQCGPCTFGLPAIADDFAQLTAGQPAGPVFARLERRLATIIGRGACAQPDAAVRLARSALSAFAADARAHGSGRGCLARALACTQPRGPVLPVPPPGGLDGWR